jgi:RNA polymerase sigma-70 factor (ECF subfamily)
VPADEPAREALPPSDEPGRDDALQRLIAEQGPRLDRLVGRLLDDPAEVDDVLQDVFVAAWEHRRRFRGESRPSTWLVSIALNKCRTRRRRRRLATRLRAWLRLSRPTEDDQAGRREIGEEVQRAVRQLPGRYREVIVLRYFEEVPVDQIARALRTSKGSVEVRLSRARQKLREILGPRLKEG